MVIGKVLEVGGIAVIVRVLDIGEVRVLFIVWVIVVSVSGWVLLGICV